jgi:phosphohistidine phosphatase SixA
MVPEYLCGGHGLRAIFVRHGHAEPSTDGDAERNLDERGRREAVVAAEALAVMHLPIERVFSSSLVRAMQTAAIVAQVHSHAEVEAEEFLVPPLNTHGIRQRLGELMRAGVRGAVLVGHDPSLGECVGELIADTRQVGMHMGTGGAACIELADEHSPTGAHLCWMMNQEQLAIIAARILEPALRNNHR